MAVAEQTPSVTAESTSFSLTFQSLLGAIVVVGSLAAVLFGIPQLWAAKVTPLLNSLVTQPKDIEFADFFLRGLAQVVGLLLLIFVGMRLAGSNPVLGLRGGIFLWISAFFTIFFLTRFVGAILQRGVGASLQEVVTNDPFDVQIGFLIMVGVALGLFFFSWRFLSGTRGQRWMVSIEEQGWISTKSIKKNQGVHLRRLTIAGILLLLGSGIYVMVQSDMLSGWKNWEFAVPFTAQTFEEGFKVILLPDMEFTLPILLAFLTVWFAWRLVNVPNFSDFLIATEAEMNKVSWTPKAKLVRDTIVVLIVVVLMTLFLLLVDLFWGFLLSRDWIRIVPKSKPASEKSTDARPDW